MSIRVGEVGKLFDLGTAFDMSSNTELTINFTKPDGTTKLTLTKTGGRVSIVASLSAGGFPSNTYMQISTIASDFDVAGVWTVCGIYQDATPKIFHSADATFTVLEACD